MRLLQCCIFYSQPVCPLIYHSGERCIRSEAQALHYSLWREAELQEGARGLSLGPLPGGCPEEAAGRSWC